MRNTALTLLTGLALAATAQAGEEYSAKAPAPAPAPCLWEWFAGASGGYAFDAKAVIWNGQVGAEYACPGSDSSHAIFLEVGYGSWDKKGKRSSSSVGNYSQKNEFTIAPITLNYKYEAPLTQSLDWFIGGGLGFAVSETKVSGRVFDGSLSDKENDTNFYGQLFVGLAYNINEQWAITTSARYIYQNDQDYKIAGDSLEGRLDNDFYWDLGFRYSF